MIIVSQPDAVTDVIMEAVDAASAEDRTTWSNALVEAYLDE